MKNWHDVFGPAIPTAAMIVDNVLSVYPDSNPIVMYMENSQLLIKKSHYQEQGFILPVDDWGTYKHPAALCTQLRRHQVPDNYYDAVHAAFLARGKQVTRGMVTAPGSDAKTNPHAVEDVNAVLTYEITNFLNSKKAKGYRVEARSGSYGIRFHRQDPYAPEQPPQALLTDVKKHIETELNVEMGQLQETGEVPFTIREYTGAETREELLAKFNDPAFAHIGHYPAFTGKDLAKERSFECFVLSQGALTPIRHGYVSGIGVTRYVELREYRIVHADGNATFLVPGRSVDPASSRAWFQIEQLVKRAQLGQLNECEVYSECLPDYLAEYLLDLSRTAHDRALSLQEREDYETHRPALVTQQVDVLPVAVLDLQPGDRFGAYAGTAGWYWCEVKARDGDIITAWVINGAYDLPFDLSRNTSLAAYGMPEGHIRIVFTAPVPFQRHASYNEAIDYMEAMTDASLESAT